MRITIDFPCQKGLERMECPCMEPILKSCPDCGVVLEKFCGTVFKCGAEIESLKCSNCNGLYNPVLVS